MDAHEIEAWANQMLRYVATVRPDLPYSERRLQWQSLVTFRTFHFHRIKPNFSQRWKRGILFEALVESHPSYQGRGKVEQAVGMYIINALRFDFFAFFSGLFGAQSHPDDIVVEVNELGVARIP
jgi:hypothetical protein